MHRGGYECSCRAHALGSYFSSFLAVSLNVPGANHLTFSGFTFLSHDEKLIQIWVADCLAVRMGRGWVVGEELHHLRSLGGHELSVPILHF